MSESKQNKVSRPAIIVVLGHVNHGKSTLLDYIRKTNTTDKAAYGGEPRSITEREAGGITQHIGAYQIENPSVTFIDTPGHKAFSAIRERGAAVADIAVLVVAADDGVKPQTLEAIEVIKKSNIPFIVAINKIDKPGADPNRAKQGLAEAGVLVEGYGGKVSVVEISAKTGQGVDELLELVTLSAELENITADPSSGAEGFILESRLDPRKGPTATLIITDGTLKKGNYIVVGKIVSPARILENFRAEKIERALPGTPVKVVGFTEIAPSGAGFKTFETKKEAEVAAASATEAPQGRTLGGPQGRTLVPLVQIPTILKADTLSSAEAIEKELAKLETEQVAFNFLTSEVGNITENDIKLAAAAKEPIILGFNVKIDRAAADLAENQKIKPLLFDIIYKLSERASEEVERRRPRQRREIILGQAKILKIFNQEKNRQIVGGQVTEGIIQVGKEFKILRREIEIGLGRIKELEQNKMKTEKVETGSQFGMSAEAKITMIAGDKIAVVEIITE